MIGRQPDKHEMNDLAHMLLGAALVALGVLAAGIADRIRGIKLTRERASSSQERRRPPIDELEKTEAREANHTDATKAMARDVIRALTTAGYHKSVAAEATWSCDGAARGTLESWTRAALGRAMRQHEEQRKGRQVQS